MASQRYIEELIPSEDHIFRRIPKLLFDDDDFSVIPPSGYSVKNPNDPKNGEEGLSVNWSKYSNVKSTRNQIGRKKPSEIEIAQLSVSIIRTAEKKSKQKIDLDVKHDPLPNSNFPDKDNRAHSLILGIWNKSKATRQLAQEYLSMNAEIVGD